MSTQKVNMVNSKSKYGWTPLLISAEKGYKNIVKLLLDTGKADVNSTDEEGRTPLLLAAGKGYGGIVQLLLENGADISVENSGWTAVQLAAFNGHEGVEQIFIIHGVPEPEDVYGFERLFL